MRRSPAAIIGFGLLATTCTGGSPHETPSGTESTPLSIEPSTLPSGPPLTDVRVTRDEGGHYVRYDGRSDVTTDFCGRSRRQQNEPSLAVDPRDPDVVAVGVNEGCTIPVNGVPWVGIYRSTDGGRTWKPGLVPGYPADRSSAGLASPTHDGCVAASDPSLAFDRGGRLFYGFICFPAGSSSGAPRTGSSTFVAVYDRDASHYVRTVLVARGSRSTDEDKINVAVDQTSGPGSGVVYAAWAELAPPAPGGFPQDVLRFSRSTDHGGTFTPPAIISHVHHALSPDLAVGPTGNVYASYVTGNSGFGTLSFWVTVLRPGARHFGLSTLVGTAVAFDSYDASGGRGRVCGDPPFKCPTGFTFPRFQSFPAIAVDAAGVHVAWNGRLDDGQSKIFVTSSGDGKTWPTPQTVDQVPVGHQWLPEITSSAGVLSVAFLDSRVDRSYEAFVPPGNSKEGRNSGPAVDVLVAQSEDDGKTWTERRATDTSFNPNLKVYETYAFNGDYLAVAGAGRSVLVAWTDLRDVVLDTDRREHGREGRRDGFDVFLPCPRATGGKKGTGFQGPYPFNPCFARGGLDQNVYFARLEA